MQSFNPEQQKIIDHILGSLLVLAPAGTGKTRVLTERVANAIRNEIPAEKILCVTFTNRAAKEMRDRLQQTCTDDYLKLTIKTFHGLCTQLLRIEAKEIGLPTDFTIFDENDSSELLKQVSGFKNYEQKEQLDELKKFIQEAKEKSSKDNLSLKFNGISIFESLPNTKNKGMAMCYQIKLQEQHALDFADLVYYTRAMLNCHSDIAKRWGDRYEFIQIDEVQDTNLSEYEVINQLAHKTGNIALIGDLDQTIYEWRGSQPEALVQTFIQDFSPECYNLVYNYRATKTLLNAASGFADSFANRKTNCTPDINAIEGDPVGVYIASDEKDEGDWIAAKIKALTQNNEKFEYNRIAILTRTNPRAVCIAKQLEQAQVNCMTVEKYDFFRRQEIKDILAHLKFLLSPFDSNSFRRILHRPTKGLNAHTIDKIVRDGANVGLKLTDFASIRTLVSGDPFRDLLDAFKDGEIVVFDTETTGLSSTTDEVIELGAVKLKCGCRIAEFKFFIKNTVPVGDSELVHHISDTKLELEGKPASVVFQDFYEFIGEALLVGHNVGFDIKMLKAHAKRLGIEFNNNLWVDTWDIAKRFIHSENYKLETLSKLLHLPIRKAHSALEDSLTTYDLLTKLIPLLELCMSEREAIIRQYGNKFDDISQKLNGWRKEISSLRPDRLLNKIVTDSGLAAHYNSEESNRIESMRKLRDFFKERDDKSIDSESSLWTLLEFTALAKNVDLISKSDNLVPIITIHQSKGLEFDTVFLAGAVDYEFPISHSLETNGNIEEEKRMFYVGLTRAKQQLFITGHMEKKRNNKNESCCQSRFIKAIPEHHFRYLTDL